ncbi:321f56a7-685e-4714-9522-67f5ea8439da-CDS [Sclerotinia trifoliorum]|uniref:321f56a7-685e-4714-9522-67f5ea8439da-CDS n=1 Tax=Sclerotinia trifoliorum TaxID=28548 RepID=A0A8H2ZIX2_9HELO|nr:321f56a7-685e-4714-9522-67f5ea8439da-CDS [Sclerotinia trifoliorum]
MNSFLKMTSAKDPPKHFSDLPAEVRCLIWKYCLPGERILPFRIQKLSWDRSRLALIRCFKNLPPPKLLHVCQESRKEASRFYRQGSWGRLDYHGQVASGWWDPSMDIIYVPYWLPNNPPSPPGTIISTDDAKSANLNLLRESLYFQDRLTAIQHLALSTKSASIRWQWEDCMKIGEAWDWSHMAGWLCQFPLLKTFTLVVDYTTYRYSAQGPRWVDHPDFAIEGRWRDHPSRWDMAPARIISAFEHRFDLIKPGKTDSNWKPPRVRIVLDEEDWEECHRREERYRRRNPGSYD